MKYFFPDPRKGYLYLQTNRSDDLGSLWGSFNLDFQTNLGEMRLAPKLRINTSSSDDADLGLPVAFEFFDDRWWAVCGTRVFKNTNANATDGFVEDASTGAQTDYNTFASDLAVFNDRLWSTTADNLYSKASGSGTGDWTSRDALNTSALHQMTVFGKFNRLYYGDDNDSVSSIDTSDVVAASGDYHLDVSFTSQNISSIKANNDAIWIATIPGSLGTEGRILQWDGISPQATENYFVKSAGVIALCIENNIPYGLDVEGRILKYTGYSFEEIARLPLNRTLLTNANVSLATSNRYAHFNGFVATKNNTLLVMVNNLNSDTSDNIKENLPSGIWELDLATGNFTHRCSTTYQTLSSSTVADYGQNRISVAGALKVNTFRNRVAGGRSYLLAGCTYFTDASSTASAIFNDSPATSTTEGQKRGYFITTFFQSSEVQDKFLRLWSIFRRFLASDDKMVFKYRTQEVDPIVATITWTSTTTFTTTTDVTAYGPTATGFNSTTGGEVEVTQGKGSGACVHITGISQNGGTYTVTIDNAIPNVTGTAKARFQKWIKMFPEVTGQVLSYGNTPIGTSDTRIQIKGVMEFTGDDEFHRFAMISNEDIKITP